MSIVRYTNKKTGVVTLYESTSHYDPETKQSRPVRKYLGIEDPETGELIPSTKQRGRKKKEAGETTTSNGRQTPDYRKLYEDAMLECRQKDKIIQEYVTEIKRLKTLMNSAIQTLSRTE